MYIYSKEWQFASTLVLKIRIRLAYPVWRGHSANHHLDWVPLDPVVDKDAIPGTSQTLMEQGEFLNDDVQYTIQVSGTIG